MIDVTVNSQADFQLLSPLRQHMFLCPHRLRTSIIIIHQKYIIIFHQDRLDPPPTLPAGGTTGSTPFLQLSIFPV
jgi:hypothetical protein